jgi:hypothetical protein
VTLAFVESEECIWPTKVRIAMVKPFVAVDGTTIVTPDLVTFAFSINGVSPVGKTPKQIWTYTNGTGDPDNMIVLDDVGLFHIDITTGVYTPGNWTWSYVGAPSNSVNLDSTLTTVRIEGSLLVRPEGFPIS